MSKRFDSKRLWGGLLAVLCVTGLVVWALAHYQRSKPGENEQAAKAELTRSATTASQPITNPTLPVSANAVASDQLMDPATDGWASEVAAEQAKKSLETLLYQWIEGGPQAAPDSSSELSEEAGRASVQTVYRQDELRVDREGSTAETTPLPTDVVLRKLLSPLRGRETPQFFLKVVGIDITTATPQATYLYEAHANTNSGGLFQQTATVHCQWSDAGKHPTLLSMVVEDLEEVHRSGPNPWFVDCTESVLGPEPSYESQLKYGLNHWMLRIERAHGMDDSVRTGLAIGDANGDGLEDVYVCQGPGLPNKLLIQQPDGTVLDVSEEAGVNWLDHTSSALFVDLDNDGDQDLTIGATGGLLVMENDGSARFRRVATLTPQMTDVQSLTAVDYDSDGDLDLFVCVYRHQSGRAQEEFVFHDASGGGRNFLFRNEWNSGEGLEFTDVTGPVGLGDGATRYTLAASWEDYDHDGDPDLYLANDYGRNYLYANEAGTFKDATKTAGLIDTGFGMSADWGDYNRDGHMDLYVGNMFSSAGSRVTRQPGFQTDALPEQRMLYQRMAQGNSLFSGTESGVFQDVSRVAQVQMGRWAWSSIFADLNNDGWEDLLVANGYITADDTGDL